MTHDALLDGTLEDAWSRALDDYEDTLERQRRVLDAIDRGVDPEPLPTFVPPDLPGPIPASLEARARHLVESTETLTLFATRLSKEARTPATGVRRSFVDATPSRIDRRL